MVYLALDKNSIGNGSILVCNYCGCPKLRGGDAMFKVNAKRG